MDMLVDMLKMQLKLQQEKMKDGDPRKLDDTTRAYFLQWNAFALTDELHEAMAEVGWKPWASSNHVNQLPFIKEMVDAWHFFMNMLIAGSGVEDMDELAVLFATLYVDKNQKNAQRMDDGYDGVITKCPECHRELSETNRHEHWPDGNSGLIFCTRKCYEDYQMEDVSDE